MEKLKVKILNCLNKKIACYNNLLKQLKKDEKIEIAKIFDKKKQQYNSVKQIFETSQISLKEKSIADIKRIAEALSDINMEDAPIIEILKCAMQSEKLHYRLFSLIAQSTYNSLTAAIFENFAQEIAAHALILERIIESK